MKIFTAHKCNGETLITKLSSDKTSDLVVPYSFLFNKSQNISKKDVIKVGDVTKDIVPLLNRYIETVSPPVITSADDIDDKTFNSLKETVFKKSLLVAVNLFKAQQMLRLRKSIDRIQDFFEIAFKFEEETSISNILLFNCQLADLNTIAIMYTSANDDFIVFRNQFECQESNGMICAAIASDLGHESSLNESVYLALEYIQNSLVASYGDDTAPNFFYGIEPSLKYILNDDCSTFNTTVPISKI
ncbi:hypothetical protein C6P44_002970 [Monosporozyma unispora]|nr:hypothetical protein C6P44_002970 [Kazachstania unispora]